MARPTIVMALGALLLAGCASTHKMLGMGGTGPTVDDLEVARLPPSQLGEVNQWRLKASQADDQVARVEVRQRDAQNEIDASKNDIKAAQHEMTAADARAKAASDRSDMAAADQARSDYTNLQARELVAKARLEAAQSELTLANAQHNLVEKERDLTRTQLEASKYRALRQADDPAARKYSEADFDHALEKERDDIDRDQHDVQLKQDDYQQKYSVWQRAQQRYTATSRPPPG